MCVYLCICTYIIFIVELAGKSFGTCEGQCLVRYNIGKQFRLEKFQFDTKPVSDLIKSK